MMTEKEYKKWCADFGDLLKEFKDSINFNVAYWEVVTGSKCPFPRQDVAQINGLLSDLCEDLQYESTELSPRNTIGMVVVKHAGIN